MFLPGTCLGHLSNNFLALVETQKGSELAQTPKEFSWGRRKAV
jgi:hypothetical protein